MQVLFMTNATLQSSTCCLYKFGTVGVTCAQEQSIGRIYKSTSYIPIYNVLSIFSITSSTPFATLARTLLGSRSLSSSSRGQLCQL